MLNINKDIFQYLYVYLGEDLLIQLSSQSPCLAAWAGPGRGKGGSSMARAARRITAKDANQKLAYRRLTVLKLAERLGNVMEACRRGTAAGHGYLRTSASLRTRCGPGTCARSPAKAPAQPPPRRPCLPMRRRSGTRQHGPSLVRGGPAWPARPRGPG